MLKVLLLNHNKQFLQKKKTLFYCSHLESGRVVIGSAHHLNFAIIITIVMGVIAS